jgi:hypothetical protein
MAINPHQVEFIPGINQVRIIDLWVGVPQLRPKPRLLQIQARNTPEGVALFNTIRFWHVVVELYRRLHPTAKQQ